MVLARNATASSAVAAAPRAVLYLRQSLDATGDGLAVARQEKACREFCATRGYAVVGTYVDNDTSASTRKPRREFTRMLSDAPRGDFDVIVAYHFDRLTRTLRDYL